MSIVNCTYTAIVCAGGGIGCCPLRHGALRGCLRSVLALTCHMLLLRIVLASTLSLSPKASQRPLMSSVQTLRPSTFLQLLLGLGLSNPRWTSSRVQWQNVSKRGGGEDPPRPRYFGWPISIVRSPSLMGGRWVCATQCLRVC